MLDIIFRHDKPQAAVPGGSTFNSIISLGRAGVPVNIVTEVGDDHVADITCKYLADNHVDSTYVYRHPGTKSHISLAFLDEQSDAHYQFYKDHASVTLAGQLPDFRDPCMVLFGSFFAVNPAIRSTVGPLLRRAHDAGALLYYDVNFRAPHVADLPQVMPFIEENMQLASIVRGSVDDFALLYQMPDLLSDDADVAAVAANRLYDERIRPHCPLFICTAGAQSIRIFTPSLRFTFPVKPTQVVSTIGAGDNFNAGVLYAIREHLQEAPLPTDVFVKQLTSDLPLWSLLVSSGQRFSQDVCQHYDNSISPSLAATVKPLYLADKEAIFC